MHSYTHTHMHMHTHTHTHTHTHIVIRPKTVARLWQLYLMFRYQKPLAFSETDSEIGVSCCQWAVSIFCVQTSIEQKNNLQANCLVYVHTHMHTHAHTCIRTHTHTHIHTHTYTHTHIHTYIYTSRKTGVSLSRWIIIVSFNLLQIMHLPGNAPCCCLLDCVSLKRAGQAVWHC